MRISEPASEDPQSALRRRPTIYDIAKVAGVSHQSVSRYLRGYEQRPDTRDRIDRALATLDYKPNLAARSLATGRSLRIGALTHDITLVGPSMILQGAGLAAREAGYLLDIVSLDLADAEDVSAAMVLLSQHDLAGIIALASTDHMDAAFRAAHIDVPMVMAGERDDSPSHGPLSGGAVGIELAIGHLVGLGHTRILHLAGPMAWAAARNRRRAFTSAMDLRGLRSDDIVQADWTAESGYRAIDLFPAERIPSAIVAANDHLALGALLALARKGLTVPTDVSIVGIDDIPESPFLSPPLTTVRLNFVEQGRFAIRSLLARMGHMEPYDYTEPQPQLIVRNSTTSPLR